MRKADYAALADIIRTKRQEALCNQNAKVKAELLFALRDMAQNFALRASVDRVAFLKACGIE